MNATPEREHVAFAIADAKLEMIVAMVDGSITAARNAAELLDAGAVFETRLRALVRPDAAPIVTSSAELCFARTPAPAAPVAQAEPASGRTGQPKAQASDLPAWAEAEADARAAPDAEEQCRERAAPEARQEREERAARLVALANACEWARAHHRVARSGIAKDMAAAHVATLAAEVDRLKRSL